MMPKRRRIVIALAVVVGVVGLASVAVDLAARRALQGWASEAVGAEVRIERVDVSLLRPQLVLGGVAVENPPGFEGETAIAIERLAVAVDLASLTSAVVTMPEVAADQFEVRYSRSGDAGNLETIESNVIAFLERRGLASEPRLAIQELRARGGQATAGVVLARVTVPLEDMAFSEMGGAEGVPPPELVAAMFDLMEPSLASALSHTDYGGLLRKGGRGVKDAARKLKGLFE